MRAISFIGIVALSPSLIAGTAWFGPGPFFVLISATSFARNCAMRSISVTGIGWANGKRIVPLLLTS